MESYIITVYSFMTIEPYEFIRASCVDGILLHNTI